MTAAYITAAIERYGRMAARFEVEPRHPFLDRDLVEFHAWLPVAMRRRDGWHKWVLRQTMQDAMPAEIIWRRRTGHLGSALAMAAIGPVIAKDFEFESVLRVLGDFVDVRKAGALMQYWRASADESAFEALNNAAQMGWWLQGSRGLPTAQGPQTTL